MSTTNKVIASFIAGAAIGVLAASLISKEDREKFASSLKVKASKLRAKLASELEELNKEVNANKSS